MGAVVPFGRPGLLRGTLQAIARNYGFIALAIVAGVAAFQNSSLAALSPVPLPYFAPSETVAGHFPICRSRNATNCVLDGDTFRLGVDSIRVADVNAPEIFSPQCRAEEARGNRAKLRLQALLNAGPFEVKRGLRDEDIFGRKLRTVHRGGRSLGDALVAEGLAHRWGGFKESWCG